MDPIAKTNGIIQCAERSGFLLFNKLSSSKMVLVKTGSGKTLWNAQTANKIFTRGNFKPTELSAPNVIMVIFVLFV